jgi:hypothetical protein
LTAFEIILAVATLLLSGGTAAVISAFGERKKANIHDVDSRIAAWQAIADKSNVRMEKLEGRFEAVARDNAILVSHVRLLEKVIMQIDPTIDIPPLPELGTYSGASGV